ncbi:MAG: energy transducer TonB, partial [Gallionella sp.]
MSIAMQQAPVIQPEPLPPKPQPKVEHTDKPVSKLVAREVADVARLPFAASPPPVAAAPAVAVAPVVDTEPDYKAGYLNNPRPAYPMVARKMGWEGRVILNVEVLAEGTCGAINVLTSSGREALDNAAIH